MTEDINPGLSLIVSTYNWPEALHLCLLSIRNQVLLPDEVIIADDGSTAETRLLIEKHQVDFPVPLIHVWQADEGFQLSKIRNKAIAKASKGYIVQVDGDLILERHFIKDHVAFRKEATFVSGTRVNMSQKLSHRILRYNIEGISVLYKGMKNLSNGLRIPIISRFLAERYKAGDPAYVRGCNMAFWKSDLKTVNGYNEAIVGWGREDSELSIRLTNCGIKKRILKFGAVTFHIYHNEVVRKSLSKNDAILQNSIRNKITTCKVGLCQYLD
jgi:glycosyltransferase involved in cell wall biosynthesis